MRTLDHATMARDGICPMCMNLEFGFSLSDHGADHTFYRNDQFTAMIIHDPRTPGHAVIASNEHYKDMMDAPEDLVGEMFTFAHRAMRALRQVYGAESVYLSSTCDGPLSHFKIQLLPRYAGEERGPRNFVRPRIAYVHDEAKLERLREMLG